MHKEKLIAISRLLKDKSITYSAKAKEFLPPQTTREKKLIISYSVLTVFVTTALSGIFSGNHSFGIGGQGSGSRTIFKVDSVITYPQMSLSSGLNQKSCAALDESSVYDQLIGEGWKITSTQNQSKPVSSPIAPSITSGECQGTLYIFNK